MTLRPGESGRRDPDDGDYRPSDFTIVPPFAAQIPDEAEDSSPWYPSKAATQPRPQTRKIAATAAGLTVVIVGGAALRRRSRSKQPAAL